MIPEVAQEITLPAATQDGPIRVSATDNIEEMKALSGLYTAKLSTYLFLGKGGKLKCFPRSAETYAMGSATVTIADAP